MMKVRVLPADKFIVINKTNLNDSDRKILLMLYQPLIGQTAVSLYFSLWAYLDKSEIVSYDWTHHHLINNMQIKLEEIIEAREKLEAIGLLKTYLKKGEYNDYIYEMYSPASPKEFLENPVLNISLYNSVGKIEFNKIIEYFKIPKFNLEQYEDITCSFNDIFMSIDFENYKPLLEDLKDNKKNKLKIVSSFDIENTLSLIPEELLNISSITNDIKDLFYKLSFIYNYSDDEMLELIKNSIQDKRIDKELLKENCRRYYKFENPDKVIGIVHKSQPEYLRKQCGTSKKDKMIYQFETTSPYQYMASKHSGNNITHQELEILEYLLDDMNLNPGVVNVIIDYVLKVSNNKLNKKFIEMVETQFSRSKIQSVEEAIDFANKEHKNNNKTKTRTKIKEVAPAWFGKEIEEKQTTKEKHAEMEKLLSKFE